MQQLSLHECPGFSQLTNVMTVVLYPCRRQLASWECPVLFSDDAAKFAAIQQLNERQQDLQARRQEVEHALQDADKVGQPACQQFVVCWVQLGGKRCSCAASHDHTCSA